MGWILVAAVVSIIGILVQQDNAMMSRKTAENLQTQSEEFNAAEAEKSRNWQEDFYLKYESPEAMLNSYKSLGMSENAALQAISGVTGSIPSGASASTGIPSNPYAGMNSFNDLFNQILSGAKTASEKESVDISNQWQPSLNDANIKSTLGQLDLNWQKFGLDKDLFYKVTVPLANNTVNKTLSEIKAIEQSIRESEERVNQIIAQSRLIKEQTITEQYKQDNLSSDTVLKQAQTLTEGYKQENLEASTVGQKIQNQLDAISLDMSQQLGMDVRLSFQNQLAFSAGKLGGTASKKVGDVLVRLGDDFLASWDETVSALKHTFDGLSTSLRYKSAAGRAYRYVKDEFDHAFEPTGKNGLNKDFKNWQKSRIKYYGESLKQLEDWINRNTRYGM